VSFTRERRCELVSRYRAARVAEDALWPRARTEAEHAELAAIRSERSALAAAIRHELPYVRMSRCPFCGFVAEEQFDPYGIDGYWWQQAVAIRCSGTPSRCPHYFCFTGALALARPIEVLDFAVEPGPEVPFVVPRLLEPSGMKMVISSTPVGRHTGYPIFYYGDPIDGDLEGPVDWGHHLWLVYRNGYRAGGSSRMVADEECDYDLAPWIARGKVQYILPGDETLTLRSTVEGCPYLNLPGRRVHNRIYKGELWPKLDEPPAGE